MDLSQIPKKSDIELLNSLLRDINIQIKKAKETQDLYHVQQMKNLEFKIADIRDKLRLPKQ